MDRGQFSYTPSVVYGDRGVVEALYVSGMMATTVGLGDVVPQSDAFRVLAVVEAGAGLATFTAAITYLISVYPLISDVRATARVTATGAPDAEGATGLALHGGQAELGRLQRGLVKFREDTNRFPVLFYFRSSDPTESFVALLRGAALVCLQLRWGLRASAVPYAPLFAAGLEDALRRVAEDYAGRFADHDLFRPLDAEDAEARLARLRAAAGQVSPDAAVSSGAPPEGFCELVGTLDALLEDLARWQRYPYQPLLAERA
ncbi:MAG TPA: potassium channel family protein [Solirubrobacteraceae bacterium]|nr:potassium channel family protein [Solirubrobacteraceae bacterium]